MNRPPDPDQITVQVKITYYFRWQNPCHHNEVEIWAQSKLLRTIDKTGTRYDCLDVPCSADIVRAARVWAGWE